MKKTTFTGLVKATASETHPTQQKLSFVFTDFLPNKNKQGVPRSEAENVIQSAINQPVKVNYTGKGVKGHFGAIPIGPITFAEQRDDDIIAEAIVWKTQFPDVAAHLEKASAETNGVQFSWELLYRDAEIDEQGTSWLQGIVVDGITIVDTPAYAGRTPLLALAEEEQSLMEELEKQVRELKDKLAEVNTAIAERDTKIADLTTRLGTVEGERDTLTSEVAELRTFKTETEEKTAKAELLSSRKTKLAEAGIEMDDDTFAKREGTFLSMTDEAFADYVSDLVAVAKAEKKSASASTRITIPDPVTSSNTHVGTKELVGALRAYRGKN